MAEATLADALTAFGRAGNDIPRHPVLHGPAGTLVTFVVPDEAKRSQVAGVWISGDQVRIFEPFEVPAGAAAAHGLTGPSARLFDLFVASSRFYLERVEEIDEELAETQQKGRGVPLAEVWKLQRRLAVLRAQIGRALVGLSECAQRLGGSFPGLDNAMPAVEAELLRVQELAVSVHQALTDLILLRNAEEANRIADAANELSKVSNRIASLANTSNIRMLGLTYIALLLGLISAVVLIPNTAGTILGMPSAAWVPGWWVVVILLVLGLIPIVVVFSRPWVRTLLGDLREFEVRAAEGVKDLPELTPQGASEPPTTTGPPAGETPLKGARVARP